MLRQVKIRNLNFKFRGKDVNIRIDKTLILSTIIVIVTFYLLTKKIVNTSFTKIPEVFYPCLELLSKGQLFQGEPFCAEGPFLFITGWLFQKVFGSYFQIALWFLTALFFLLLLYLMYRISKKETGKYNVVLISFLVVLWLWEHIIDGKLEKTFAVIFTFFGFYLLYYSEIKFKEVISSAFFGIAVFSSINAFVPVFLCIAYYPIQIGLIKLNNARLAISKNKNTYLKIVYLLLPLAAIYIILLLIWPNFMDYTFFSHNINPRLSYGEALMILIPWGYVNVNIFLAYVILLISLYIFYKTKNAIPIIGSIGLLGVLIPHHRGIGELLIDRMTAPVVPFVILTIILLKQRSENNDYIKVVFAGLLSVLLIFPSFGPNSFGNAIYNKLDYSLENFKKEVGYGVNLLPEQKNEIFVNYKEILTNYDYEIKYPDKIIVVSDNVGESASLFDLWNSPRLAVLLKLDPIEAAKKIQEMEAKYNIGKDDENKTDKYMKTILQLKNTNFDFIIVGPKFGNPTVNFLWRAYELPAITDKIRKEYGIISIPDIELPSLQYSHVTGVALKREDGDMVRGRFLRYYTLVFDDICKKSEFIARDSVKDALWDNSRIKIDKTCKKGLNKFIDNYNNWVLWPEHIFFISVMILLIMIAYVPILKKNGRLNTKKEKKIYYWMMLILLALAILFFIKIFYVNINYKEISNQVKEKYDVSPISKVQENIDTFIERLSNKDLNMLYSVLTNFSEEGIEEHMWVIVQDYRDDIFYGYVKDEPRALKNLKINDSVKVKRGDVKDWIIYNLLTNTFDGYYTKPP